MILESGNKIVLNMIVKNEGHCDSEGIPIILRCLQNMRPMLDAVSIDDTGSDDNTIELIENFCKKEKLPHKVWRSRWYDFGTNRSLAIRHCEEFLDKIDPPVMLAAEDPSDNKTTNNWWVMFNDADNLVYHKKEDGTQCKIVPKLNKMVLQHDLYTVDSRCGSTHYDYRYVIKVDPTGVRRWAWHYPLHEYVGEIGGWKVQQSHLQDLLVESRREGGRNLDPFKSLNDALVLERHLKKNPGDGRTTFYLAQSYRDSGIDYYPLAIKHYKFVTDNKGSWVEERYFAALQVYFLTMALFYKNNTNPEKVLPEQFANFIYLYKAIELNPRRLEAPYEIVDTFRRLDQHYSGCRFGKNFLEDFSISNTLFASEPIYSWKFFDTLSVCCYYGGDKPLCKKLANRALESGKVPPHEIERVKRNAQL